MRTPASERSDTDDSPPVGLRLLEALFEREYEPMVRLAFTLLGELSEAEEVVQESFVDVHRRLDELRQPGAYLRVAVVNRCRSSLRRRRTRERAVLPRPEPVTASADELWDVLGKLPDEQRIAVVLRYQGGYRASEIADAMDCPAATVRSWLRRGLATLRKELS